MKKLILIFMAASIVAAASSLRSEREIYGSIIRSLFPDKKVVRVWTDDEQKRQMLSKIPGVEVVQNREGADLLMVEHTDRLEVRNKKLFVIGYQMVNRYKDRMLGAFYWQKGRPNLVFMQKSLQAYNIHLPKDLQRYVEEEF